MDRYSKITEKNPREIVLLKAFPCVWGKCLFCDYIDDNSQNEEEMNKTNFEVLENITGEFGVLEVINSGSCFEIPKKTLEKIREIVLEKNIKTLWFESHWCYKNRLEEMKEFFKGVEVKFKIGVETFDNDFRNGYLNKCANFKTYEDVRKYFNSPCLLVGMEGQTKEMIKRDIEIVENYFERGTINVFVNNTTPVKRDEELVKWYCETFKYLDDNPNIEVLYNNTDFGVGD